MILRGDRWHNGVPADHFRKIAHHFDADGNYVIKDLEVSRIAKAARGMRMALAEVQAGSAHSISGGSAGNVLSGNCTVGNCVAVAIVGPNGFTIASVSSPMGTFTLVNFVQNTDCLPQWWYVCTNVTTASTQFTVTFNGGGGNWNGQGSEWSGGVTSATSASNNSGTSGTASQTVSPVTSGNVVIVQAETDDIGTASFTGAPSSPWTVFNSGSWTLANGVSTAWQVTSSTSNVTASWSLSTSDQWSTLAIILVGHVAPSAPTLTSPTNASYQDVSSGLAFSGTYNGAVGDNQNAYAFRIKVSSGSYNYWNAGTSALQGTIVWNSISTSPGGSFGPTLPNTAISDGNVYNWSMASQEAGASLQGPFATDFTFTAQAPPTVVVNEPTGSIGGTLQPAVTWTTTPPVGASQTAYQVIVESGSYSTTPGSGTQAWTSGVVSSTAMATFVGNGGTPPSQTLSSGVTYRFFVQVTETGGQTSSWAYSTATLTVDVPATPTVTAVETTDPNTGCPCIEITVQGYDNYLNANDSSFEGGGTGSVGSWTGGSGTAVAASDNFSLDGAWSLKIGPDTSSIGSAISGKYAITAATEYWFTASILAATYGASCSLKALWYDGATLLATDTIATAEDASTPTWTQLQGHSTAPSSANYVALEITTGTGTIHYLDEVGFFPNGQTEWYLGGFYGSTYVQLLRSDGVYVRWASQANPMPLGASGTAAGYWQTLNAALQLSTLLDYEVIPGDDYSYQATVIIQTPSLASASATSGTVDYLPNPPRWWSLNPLNPATASNAQFVGWTPVQIEQSGSNQVLNVPVANVVANAMMNQEFSANAETFTDAIYNSFQALLTGQQTCFVSSPWGAIDSGYFRFALSSTSGGGGSGSTAKNVTLHPSVIGSGHRSTAVLALAQFRPQV